MKRQRMTQTDRVYALLRRRGEQGITAGEVAPPVGVDGGPPIFRVAARIADLRDRGQVIVTEGRRDGFAVYVLRERQRVTVAAPAHVPGASGQLVLDTPRSAILGPEDAA